MPPIVTTPLPAFTGIPGRTHAWLVKIRFMALNPSVLMSTLEAFGYDFAGDKAEVFNKMRQSENWPLLLFENLAPEDAETLRTTLELAGVDMSLSS